MKRPTSFLTALLLIFSFFAGAPWFDSWAQNTEDIAVKSICAGPLDTIYMLNHPKKIIEAYTFNGVKKASFALDKEVDVLVPRDVIFARDELIIADSEACALHFFSKEGDWIRSMELDPDIFVAITAIEYAHPYILLADRGCFWVLEWEGEVVQRVDLPRPSNGAEAIISSMGIDQGKLYLTQQWTQEILIFKMNTAGRGYDFAASMGGFGYEEGRFLHLNGLSVKGRIFAVDRYHPGYLDMHPLDQTLNLYTDTTSKLRAPTDILAVQDQLFLACGYSDALHIYPLLSREERYQPVISHNLLDFGTVPLTPPYVSSFYVYNATGFPMEGALEWDHPAFILHPVQFNGTANQIKVFLDPEHLGLNMELNVPVLIKLPEGKTEQVMLRAKVAASPDFQVVFPDRQSFSTICEPLLFQLHLQHQLIEDQFTFEVRSTEIPFRFRKKSAHEFYLEPIENPAPGVYTVQFLVRSPAIRVVKQFSYSFFFMHPPDTFSGNVLAEYFAADWCPLCPSGHKALLELNERFSRDELNFLTIYTDCVDDSPVQLCFKEGQTRMRWYVPSGTHVSLFLNGTDYLHGGTSEPGATMTPYYLVKIEPLLKKRMPISLTAYADWDEETRKIKIGATVIQPSPEENKDLRLMVALAENNIEWRVITGQTSHNFVSRQFIAQDNPEGDSAFGTPLANIERQDLLLEAEVTPVAKMDQSFILVFVQDRKTRQIYQTRYIKVNPGQIQHDFILKSHEKTLWLPHESSFVSRFYLQNRGNFMDQYILHLENAETYPRETMIQHRQKSYSLDEPLTVSLNPMEVAVFDVQIPSSFDPLQQPSIQLWAKSHTTEQQKAAALRIEDFNAQAGTYRWLFPPKHQITDEYGMATYLSRLNWTIKSLPGSRIIPDHGVIYQEDGKITVPWSLEPGLQEAQWTLVLPDQSRETITLKAFRKLSVVLSIGRTLAWINDEDQFIDAPPMIVAQRTLVPLRFIAEAFDAEVSYDGPSRTVTVIYRETMIQLQIGEPWAMVGDQRVALDVPSVIYRGRTFIPLRFMAETFGAEVSWEDSTRQVLITIYP